jgi:2-oxo-3-hexenedioate decarboxylase
MPTIDPNALARELMAAYANKEIIAVPPASRDPDLDLATAYQVEAELVRLRTAGGTKTAGLKVGFANRALWRALKLETLVWAHLYDDTVRYADRNAATLAVDRMIAPKIEPEIVFKLKAPLGGGLEPADVLAGVEWFALGFEIIDSVFADWKFQPADFVASFGFHAALIVGEPRLVIGEDIRALLEQLATFKVKLWKDGQLAAEGAARNVLRSPVLSLAELAVATSRTAGATPLAPGDLISSGTLTDSQLIAPGETWAASLDGIDLPKLTLVVG